MNQPNWAAADTEALWQRHLGLVRLRLDLVAAAADEARAGALSAGTRARAQEAAHQLAGALDTYGRTGGSAVARAAENLLRDAAPDAIAEGLGEFVTKLRLIIEPGP